MNRVAVRLLHREAGPSAGPLEGSLAAVRLLLAARVADGFRRAGSDDVAVLAGPPDDTPFGRRLRDVARAADAPGLVVAGSGALGLAEDADLRRFVEVAGSDGLVALANNRYSADAVGIACAATLASLPDLAADNALPRWLAEIAGYDVRDLRGRRRLQVDVDGPVDARLVGVEWPVAGEMELVDARIAAVATVAHDPRAELLVSGRTSAATLRALERGTPARVRALVEERGLRAAAAAARSDGAANTRSPRSVLGLLLDRDGPAALGALIAMLADAAVVDSRVLLAHRFGADEAAWPALEDRLASDLLLADRIADPWLRELTRSAVAAPVPVVLAGHSIVGPGLPLLLGVAR